MKPYKIGYTTGVFDLFHIGHLNILKKAKQHCDFLIVGVSTDELVVSYKNKWPVFTLAERVAIVQSIQFVDKVVHQVHRDKFGAWKAIQFDIMFVGDDWKGDPLFKKAEQQFQEVGVEVMYFPYTQGISSTKVKEKMML